MVCRYSLLARVVITVVLIVGCTTATAASTAASASEYNRERRSDPDRTDDFYSSRSWRRLRAAYLAEHPFCEACLGHLIYTIAVLVDHIIPIRQGGAPLEWSNLQSMCTSCHATKSARERRR
jgi:5-methylcytosine-specific restriction enzyme A